MDKIHPATSGRKALTIEQFCADHNICRATFYNLAKIGQAPRIMKVGGKRLVSEEAAAAWRAAMTEAA
jgi:predicted DNA-binding transcriptional regulator AlpA